MLAKVSRSSNYNNMVNSDSSDKKGKKIVFSFIFESKWIIMIDDSSFENEKIYKSKLLILTLKINKNCLYWL